MKFVILTSNKPEHQYVVSQLVKQLGNDLAAIVVENGNPNITSKQKALRKLKAYGPIVFVERLITKAVRKLIREQSKFAYFNIKILGQCKDVNEYPNVIQTTTSNSKACIEQLKSIDPDYILVYGTGIVRDKTLDIAKHDAFNMHTGISPYYRGSSCIFWPLLNREFHLAGATVHQCTREVDGGQIYKTKAIHLEPEENQYTAFAKAVKAGTDLYVDLVSRLQRGETPDYYAQDFTLGKEYRFTHQTFFHDLKMAFDTQFGLLKRAIIKYKKEQASQEKEVRNDEYLSISQIGTTKSLNNPINNKNTKQTNVKPTKKKAEVGHA